MKKIAFKKMHGLGNDYIYVNADRYLLADPNAFSEKYANRRLGIGGDGLILYGKGQEPHYRMRIFNADGSEGLMCGNAIRCVAKILYEEGLDKTTEMDILTASGTKRLTLTTNSADEVVGVRVDMNPPTILAPEVRIPHPHTEVVGVHVGVGNPHLVHFMEQDLWEYPLEEVGTYVEHHERFQPERVNYEIARVVDKHTIEMRVWERGSGITMACGTGACVTAVAAIYQGLAKSPVQVQMPGGNLTIEWSGREEEPVFMTGGATFVFDGEVYE